MSINRWRYVEYTDDGCALFECLQCYNRWEMRSAPGFTLDGTYHPIWHFCPVCGTKWDGKRETVPESEDPPLGPRRRKIREAEERWRWDHGWPTYKPPFYWQLEARQNYSFFDRKIDQQPWEVHKWIKGLSMPAKAVLAHARHLKQQMEADVGGGPAWTTQVRVTKTRERPRAGYEIYRELNA